MVGLLHLCMRNLYENTYYLAASVRQSATASMILLDVSVAPATVSTSHVLPSTIACGTDSRAAAAIDCVSLLETISTAEILPSAIVVLTVIGPS